MVPFVSRHREHFQFNPLLEDGLLLLHVNKKGKGNSLDASEIPCRTGFLRGNDALPGLSVCVEILISGLLFF